MKHMSFQIVCRADLQPQRHTNLPKTPFARRLRLTGAMGLLAGAILLLPIKGDPVDPFGYVSTWAAGAGGDHGGARDQVNLNANTTYTSYATDPVAPVTPCQSCYGGSGTAVPGLIADPPRLCLCRGRLHR
jgi:hypothetical protein